MKILVHYPFTDDQVAGLEATATAHGHRLVHVTDEDAARREASDAEALLGFFTQAVTAAAPALRWIQSFSAGMDNFLYPEIVARDEVVVTNTAGLYAPQGGEHAWALLLALSRGIVPAVRHMDDRRWGGVEVVELGGGTLGIVGLGGFGRETARRAAGYGMRVIGLDPGPRQTVEGIDELREPSADNLRWLLSAADAVVVACPLTPSTHHLIDAEALAAMRPTAYLVCVSRGGIVEETALARALTTGRLAGAGLDVCEVEPLPADSPLWTAPNLILTPHRAGASQHRPRKIYEFFRDNLERYLTDRPLLNVVDKGLGY